MYDLSILDESFSGDDLEWKVQTCGIGNNGKPWALIVPYVANRAIMSRLDKAVGKLNWKNEYRDIGDKGVECGIAIRCPETSEWIWKFDAAECSDIEPVKGGRSNSMKRAAVQWGMGRHLYNIGETWAECTTERQNGTEWTRAKTKDKREFYWRVPKSFSPSPQPQRDEQPKATQPSKQPERDCARLFAIAGKTFPKTKLDELKPLLGVESWKTSQDWQFNLACVLVELAVAHGWETMLTLVSDFKQRAGDISKLTPAQVKNKIQQLNQKA